MDIVEERTGKAECWGRIFNPTQALLQCDSGSAAECFKKTEKSFLPYGLGRSYGDSCLNEGGYLISTKRLNNLISFDEKTGILRAQAGVPLADLVWLFAPRGWFPPVVPGTKFVTIGGAIANDIHGKNHHSAGTFGCHVERFELLRSDGSVTLCSAVENSELFAATIGGLGLTGLILWAEIRMRRCNPDADGRALSAEFYTVEAERYQTLDQFFEVNKRSETNWEYTVSWVDCLSSGEKLGRGVYLRGNHASLEELALNRKKIKGGRLAQSSLSVPFDAPTFLLNSLSVRAFNFLYYNKQLHDLKRSVQHYDPFFFPLDSVHNWNRLYGKRGFYQYQFVVPFGDDRLVVKAVFEELARTGSASFLAVLKTFGSVVSPGMLSFPRPGVTLAVDIKNMGEKTEALFKRLDALMREGGGILYPAKDARMLGSDFKAAYPRWEEFAKHVDPRFSSSFWRRIMQS